MAEEHVVVYRYRSAAKGKPKAKRPKQLEVGDRLECLRSELDILTPVLPLEESEELEENLKTELDCLPSLLTLEESEVPIAELERASLLPRQRPQEPKELEEPQEAEDLEEAAEHEQPKELEEAEELEQPKEHEEAEEHEQPKEHEEAEEHEQRKEHEETKEHEEAEEHEESKAAADLINGEVSKSKTVQVWHRGLLRNFRILTPPPTVTNSMFYDARKLFGVNFDNQVTLRNPGYVGGYEDIVLHQFDPNFMSTEVVCCHPSCDNINPAAAKSGKRDLYLCLHHQQELRNSISDVLAKYSVQISTIAEKPEPGHFAGYTSLISLLEGAFHDGKKFQTPQGKSPMVQEAILNVRNFLIITSTVLNPDQDNLGIALPPVVEILKLILENPDAIERLVASLQEVIKSILFAFGVIYKWVSLILRSPGQPRSAQVSPAQIGARVGACIGASAFVLGLWSGAAGVTFGWTLGRHIRNSFHNLSREQRWQEKDGLGPNRQPHNQYPAYYFCGDAKGGFTVHLDFNFQPYEEQKMLL
ncbi:uncharacterized protein LOC110052401 [Orbicella faveolata]|uniref:uncharacterized protein LOC110052401 n=1 Tax=Orbicella faveolata TaxID=48498 RepID=UPI0009E51BD9|nr:uncharacterized protein LOC110052401 [Orbicella faveolata]